MTPPTETAFEPRIEPLGGGSELFYQDGFVVGAVDIHPLDDGREGLVVHEWSSLEPGHGHTARALAWLRERYARIAANGVGTIDVEDGVPVPDISVAYWEHMRAKGLVDVLIDDHGCEIPAPEASKSNVPAPR